MDLYPSIDLLDGHVVRLLRGDYDAETVYGDDPIAVARGRGGAGGRGRVTSQAQIRRPGRCRLWRTGDGGPEVGAA